MAQLIDVNLTSPRRLSGLVEFDKDYCSDHLGLFFQNKYSLPALSINKFQIPVKLATKGEKDCFAICVMMNNHIVDLKYFSDILPEWDKEIGLTSISPEQSLDKIDMLINDQRLLSVIKRFNKINEEILIGRCSDLEFTPV
jgi:hypothetical protein